MTGLVNSLLDETVSFYDTIKTYGIVLTLFDLGPGILGMVYKSRKGNYHVVVNSSLTFEAQQKVFFHELKHITRDLPALPYFIGLDMQHHEIEKDADNFFEEVAASYNLGL